MTLKQITLALTIAIALTLAATLGSLSQLLPAPLAYFLVAAMAASLALALAGKTGSTNTASPSPRAPAATVGGGKEQGSVKWFSASKGFGFITRDSGEDIFVHFRSINSKGNRVLREGQRVEFSIGTGSKGPQAEDVTALS